jgi:hypothetical protein
LAGRVPVDTCTPPKGWWVADQTFTPVEFVAKTGRAMWSARTKEMTPPSITATGSHPFQTYARISAPVASLYSAILRPSLSKTEWMGMAVVEARVLRGVGRHSSYGSLHTRNVTTRLLELTNLYVNCGYQDYTCRRIGLQTEILNLRELTSQPRQTSPQLGCIFAVV